MTEPLVSILIPCFNAERFLAESIESALSQTYRNIEVIVIDDGSTDGSLDIIKQFDRHIRWETGPNRGACAARNRALALSRGSFIQFLDADDTIVATKIETQLSHLIDGGYGLVFCRSMFLKDETRPVEDHDYFYAEPEDLDPLFYTMRFSLGTNGPLHRRENLDRVGGFRIGLPRAQEMDLHWRLGAARLKLGMVDEFLVVIRDHTQYRISKSKIMPNDYLLNLFMINVLEMQIRSQIDTLERRKFVANRLIGLADIAHRHGCTRASAMGFSLAQQIASDRLDYSNVWWRQMLCDALGSPWRAAEILRRGRALRDALLPRSSRPL